LFLLPSLPCGYGGVDASYLNTNISSWLNADTPDVILLMIGINDIGQGASGNPTAVEASLNTLVQNIVNLDPKAHLVVAQITPYATYTDSTVQYSNYIKNRLVPHYSALGKNVSTVDQYSNFGSGTSVNSSLYSNGINHPNASGYDMMAQTWCNGIQALGPIVPSSPLKKCGCHVPRLPWACEFRRNHAHGKRGHGTLNRNPVFFNGLLASVLPRRFAVVGDRLVIFALLQIHQAAIVVGCGKPRIEAQCLAEIGNCLVVLAFSAVGVAAVAIGIGKPRCAANGLGVVGDRLVEVALLPIDIGPLVIGLGVFWVAADGLGEVGQRFGRIALAAIDAAAADVAVGILRVQPDGLIVTCQGRVEVPLCIRRIALSRRIPGGVGGGLVRRGLDVAEILGAGEDPVTSHSSPAHQGLGPQGPRQRPASSLLAMRPTMAACGFLAGTQQHRLGYSLNTLWMNTLLAIKPQAQTKQAPILFRRGLGFRKHSGENDKQIRFTLMEFYRIR
jgi:hypothetical protein